jgi:hypothetical protein
MKSMILAFVTCLILPAPSPAGRIVIDQDTTIDYVIGPFEPPIDIVNGPSGPTTVEIVEGANIAPNIHVRNQSILNIRDGIIGGFVWAYDQAAINVHDGHVATGEDIVAEGSSLINIYGGRFGDSVYSIGSSVINLYGGTFDKAGDGATIFARESGTINVFGRDFALGPPGNAFRSLTGTLSDGNRLDVYVLNDSTVSGPAQVILHTIPEPAMSGLLLAGLGVFSLLRRRRSRMQRRITRGVFRGPANWQPLFQEVITCPQLFDDDSPTELPGTRPIGVAGRSDILHSSAWKHGAC